METEKVKSLMSLGSLFALVGLILLFLSNHFGTALADSWLMGQGEYADSFMYQYKVQAHSNNFLVCGSILFWSWSPDDSFRLL